MERGLKLLKNNRSIKDAHWCFFIKSSPRRNKRSKLILQKKILILMILLRTAL